MARTLLWGLLAPTLMLLTMACASSSKSEATAMGLLTGRIINANGAPFAKVSVSTDPPTTYAITKDNGRFTLGLPTGRYTLVIKDGNGEVVRKEVVVSGTTKLGDVKIAELKAAAEDEQ